MKLRWIAWLILLAGMLVSRGDYFEALVYSTDEAEYAVLADALPQGALPGLDLLGSTKPPGIALVYRVLFELFGRSMQVLHMAHPFILIAAGIFLVELAIALWGTMAALPTALLFWMFTNSFNLPDEMIALNVESPGLLFMLPALWLVYRYPRRAGLIVAAGVLLGLSVLMRQSFVFFLLPALVAILAVPGQWIRRSMALALGLAVVWLPLLALYAARGALGWTWDSWVRYPSDYASDTGLAGFLQAAAINSIDFAWQCAPSVVLAVIGAVRLAREPWTAKTGFLAAFTLAGALALASGSRFCGHYWYQLFPALTLLSTFAWLRLADGSRRARLCLMAAVAVGCVIAVLHFPAWRWWDENAPPKGHWDYPPDLMRDEVLAGNYIREHTRPDEGFVVWGYAPQLYFYAQRQPGVRDFICHYITGYSAGSFDPLTQRAFRANGHPRAEAMFVEDLERRQPPYILDLAQIEYCELTFIQYPLLLYPRLAAYVRSHYEPDTTIHDIQIYRRRHPAVAS